MGEALKNDNAPFLFVFSPNPEMVITILVCTVTRSGENEVDCVEKQVPEDICILYIWVNVCHNVYTIIIIIIAAYCGSTLQCTVFVLLSSPSQVFFFFFSPPPPPH